MIKNKSFTVDEIKRKLENYCVYQDRCHKEVEQKMREYNLIPEVKIQNQELGKKTYF
jgi:regulatory protein